jgi:tetratricopeptide (TPR) repeat protein
VTDPTPSSFGSAPASAHESAAETLVDDEIEYAELGQGATLGRYVIVGELGRGGMGVVYAAYDPELDRKVALKLLTMAREKERSTTGRARLIREAQAMARLTHPNVVTVHDVGLHESMVFVAMEFVDGLTLKDWLAEKKPDWRRALAVACQAGEGLAAAHAAGLVHRDFKPENVMVARDGRVLVMDFGLARATEARERETPPVEEDLGAPGPSHDSLSSDITRAGAVLGTPHYMAPEQHLGLSTDARTDQFNFSVTLYEALYGHRPFEGKKLTELVLNVTGGNVREPPPGTRVPGWVREVVLRGLAVEPEGRWPSMNAMLEQLRADPTPRRRVLAAAAGVVALAIGVFSWQAWDERSQRAGCAELGRAIDEVWGEEQRAVAERALTRGGLSYGLETWDRVAHWFDAYAEEWKAVRTEVCLATTVEHRRSRALHDRSSACLAERRERFAALTTALSEADPTVVQRAVRAAATLPPVEQCTDDEWLAERVPLPDDPTAREAVQRLRAKLEHAAVQLSIARYDASLGTARDVLEQADAVGYEPLQAEARLAVGRALSKKAAYAEAEPELERAFVSAGGIGHDEVAAQAAGELASTVGNALGRHADGLRWASLGEMSLRRSRSHDPVMRGWLLASRGVIQDLSGDYDAAIATHEEAIRIFSDVFGADHPDVAYAHNNLGTALHAKGDYAGALREFQKVLEIRRVALGEGHPDVAMALNNVGAAYYSRGEYDRAVDNFERALEIREKALGSGHPDVGQSLHNLANLVNKRGERTRAVEMYERALAIFREHLGPEHANVAATLDNIGLIEQARGHWDRAIERHLAALAIWEKAVGPDHPEIATCLGDLARAYLGRGDVDEAVARYERARDIVRKVHGEAHPDLGRVLEGLGEAHLQAGHDAMAVATLEQSLAILEGADLDAAQSAQARFGLARALEQSGRKPARALELARRAQSDLRAAGEGYEELLSEVDAWLAEHE